MTPKTKRGKGNMRLDSQSYDYILSAYSAPAHEWPCMGCRAALDPNLIRQCAQRGSAAPDSGMGIIILFMHALPLSVILCESESFSLI